MVWPIPWLQPVSSLRVLGVIMAPTYRETIRVNWEKVEEKLRNCIMSWRNRILPQLETYALSKVWYLASILPLPRSSITRIQALMGSFLWKGHLERVSLEQLKWSKDKGGINLVCVERKARALFQRQTLRLVGARDHRALMAEFLFGHRLLPFWGTVVGASLKSGPRVQSLPAYTIKMCEAVKLMVVPGKSLREVMELRKEGRTLEQSASQLPSGPAQMTPMYQQGGRGGGDWGQ